MWINRYVATAGIGKELHLSCEESLDPIRMTQRPYKSTHTQLAP